MPNQLSFRNTNTRNNEGNELQLRPSVCKLHLRYYDRAFPLLYVELQSVNM